MPTTPYDSCTVAINQAKTRLNDDVTTLAAVGGKVLDNTQAFTQQVTNGAWRKLQEFLAELGYTGLKQELTFAAVPACVSSDPLVQVYLNYQGYYDGATLQSAPVLPQNFIRPYDLWERASGSSALLTEMDVVLNGLPSVPKSIRNIQWEWRDDVLYMPGATVITDLRIRYAGAFSDFVDVGGSATWPYQTINTPWFNQPIPIMRCIDSFADYICRELSIARGDMDAAAAFQASAEMNARKLVGRDTAQPKAIYKAAEYSKMRDRYTPKSGVDTEPIDRA